MREIITKNDFAEFYCLSALSPIIERRENSSHRKLLLYRNELVHDIIKFYIPNIQKACVQEAAYDHCRKWPNIYEENCAKLLSIGIDRNTKINDNFLYARVTDKSPSNMYLSTLRLSYVFKYFKWQPSYGGPAWARIAELLKELYDYHRKMMVSHLDGYHMDCGYDTATYSSIRSIRHNMNGEIDKNVNHLMHILDMIHQVEHNTGSVFTKFGHDVWRWMDKMLNEKAISSSLQLLRSSCKNTEIIESLNNLNIDNSTEETIEIQLGEVILSRESNKNIVNVYAKYNDAIDLLNEDLINNFITTDIYNNAKNEAAKILEEDLKQPMEICHYTNALLAYCDSDRDLRAIFRQIINNGKIDKRICDKEYNLLYYAKNNIYCDYVIFKLLIDNSEWHDALLYSTIRKYDQIPAKWKKEATDFFYSMFKTLEVGTYYSQGDLNHLYDKLSTDGYDMSPYSDKKIGDSYKSANGLDGFVPHTNTKNKPIFCSCNKCSDTRIVYYNVYMSKFVNIESKLNNAFDLAHKYAGQSIKKIGGKFADKDIIAGMVLGYKKGKNSDDFVVWMPTIEYSNKYTEYLPAVGTNQIILTHTPMKESDVYFSKWVNNIHWTKPEFLEFNNNKLLNLSENDNIPLVIDSASVENNKSTINCRQKSPRRISNSDQVFAIPVIQDYEPDPLKILIKLIRNKKVIDNDH